MSAKTYLPAREQALADWLGNFAVKLPTHAAALGLSGADVTAAVNDANYLRYLIETVLPQRRTELQELTSYKDLIKDGPATASAAPLPTMAPLPPAPPAVPPGVLPRLRALVQRIKTQPGYTASIGEDLGIVAPEVTAALGKPEFTATALPNHEVRLDWKRGRSDGVRIESQRGAETTWSHLADDRFAPYVDTRPPLTPGQVEQRRYRIRHLDGDTPTGDYSDIAAVSTRE